MFVPYKTSVAVKNWIKFTIDGNSYQVLLENSKMIKNLSSLINIKQKCNALGFSEKKPKKLSEQSGI